MTKLGLAAGEFLLQQPGADFAADLAYSRCTTMDTAVEFTPVYTPPALGLSDAAYCLYRLELDPATAPATLNLAWSGAVPAAGQCWLGLANWGSARWDWLPLAGADTAISNPADYAGADKHCYAALVVLGVTPVMLNTIGFGTPPPPVNNGYTLLSPMDHKTTYLLAEDGTVVHSWASEYEVGSIAHLDADGSLWRQEELPDAVIRGGGFAGRLARFAWDNTLLWEFELSTATECTHHDFELLPNGNILLIVWVKYTVDEMRAMGCDPAKINEQGMLLDAIYEITPQAVGAEIVWQWFVKDHLVQDYDAELPNYGDPAQHPELVNINYQSSAALDWTHFNTVDYNPELDQIIVNSPTVGELWIIDHATTTAEAAGHTAGRYGRGGDLLYRWGNPSMYGGLPASERSLSGQHNAHWIPPGLPGAGDILIFNNGAGAIVGNQYSAITQITPPLNPDGSYSLDGTHYGPAAPTWSYVADPPQSFFSGHISSSQRLPNGNTFICSGAKGKLFEVTAAGEIVWQYTNPYPNLNAPVFRAIRYQADYSGLAGLP